MLIEIHYDAEYNTNGDVPEYSKILYEMLTGEVPKGPEYWFNIIFFFLSFFLLRIVIIERMIV